MVADALYNPINNRMIPDLQEWIYYTPETNVVFKIIFNKKLKKNNSQNHQRTPVFNFSS